MAHSLLVVILLEKTRPILYRFSGLFRVGDETRSELQTFYLQFPELFPAAYPEAPTQTDKVSAWF